MTRKLPPPDEPAAQTAPAPEERGPEEPARVVGDGISDTPGAGPRELDRTLFRPGRGIATSDTQTFNDEDRKKLSAVVPEAAALSPEQLADSGDKLAGQAKYTLLERIGRGGMGEVFEVLDNALDRKLALKRLRAEVSTPQARKLFRDEARITAQLEHPHIVPVHESGVLETGEVFFTMKRLRGSTLRDLIIQLKKRDPATQERFPPMKVGIMFLEIVRAVAYAHARGVVHCDLKPGNVLVGEHGEVVVADWGLARKDAQPPPVAGATPVKFPREHRPAVGVVSGTVPYMAPEQAEGLLIDRRCDVYALGAILYELLTLESVYPATSIDDLLRQFGGVIAPRRRTPHREISEEIEAVCLKCLELVPNKRYDSAIALAVDIEAWLTGTRRRQQAETAFAEGQVAEARRDALRHVMAQLDKERARLEEHIKPFDGEGKKAPLWAVEERLFQTTVSEEEALAEALDGYQRASSLDPSYVPPQDRLADLHLALFLDAEARGKKLEEHLHRREVERNHRGRHALILDGRGTLRLMPRVAGAQVRGFRLVEQGKRIVRGEMIANGPIEGATLPMGSYAFDVSAAGYRSATVHVRVGRGASVDLEPALYPDDVVGAGFVHVPAGLYIAGGDETALNSEPRVVRELPDFFIARYPVTCGEYVRFLNDLAQQSPALAKRHVPRTKPEGGALWEPDASGAYRLPERDADGNPVHPDAPVMGVSFYDAEMYAAHLSTKEGVALRLPTEHEWEKAARGADGRFFPWGNGFDPSFCKMALSRPGRPQPEPVGSFPVDESVYGMRDAAGAIREWTDSFFDPGRETRTLRGGAWYFNPHYCRLAFRHGYLPHIVFTNFGFRLAKSAPPK